MISKTSTKDMPREEWLAERMKGIGGSDAAAILGLNPYHSPYALWTEKTGKITPEDISDKEAVRLGNDLEQYVAERFTEKTGKKVRRENFILRNSDYPFAHANIDRWVIGENAGLECKTSSSYDMARQCKEGEIPKHYYCQCVHYMMVTGAQKWYLGILVFGSGFYLFEIERNEDEIAALADAERCFWENVTRDVPPAIDGSQATTDALQTIFAESNGESVDLTGVSNFIDLYNEVGRQIKGLENLRDEYANHIKEYMGEAEKGTYGDTTVSWKTQTRRTLDKEAVAGLLGTIPENCFKASSSRPFKVTVKKTA